MLEQMLRAFVGKLMRHAQTIATALVERVWLSFSVRVVEVPAVSVTPVLLPQFFVWDSPEFVPLELDDELRLELSPELKVFEAPSFLPRVSDRLVFIALR